MQNAAGQRESENAAPAEILGPVHRPGLLLSSSLDVGAGDTLGQAIVR